jgi:mono/diheme cytochrome c family protein
MTPRPTALLAASMAAVACLAALPAEAASPARGRPLVQRNCGVCHSVAAKGGSPNPMAPPLRDLHNYFAMDQLAEALRAGLLSNHPAMPQFRFTVGEVDDIVAYLQSIQSRAEARQPISERLR